MCERHTISHYPVATPIVIFWSYRDRAEDGLMYQIDLEKAKSQMESLIQAALGGEEVVITLDHEPVVKLVPIPKSNGRRKAGSAKGMISMSEDFDEPLEDFREYME